MSMKSSWAAEVAATRSDGFSPHAIEFVVEVELRFVTFGRTYTLVARGRRSVGSRSRKYLYSGLNLALQ